MNNLHKTSIDISEQNRIQITEILNKSLATISDLKVSLKQAHWNVKGMQFFSLHLLFDEIAKELEDQTDILAERITSLGGTALGTIQEAVKNSILPPYPLDIFEGKEHINAVAERLAIATKLSRENIKKTENLNDLATNDIFIDLARLLDKRLWFIEAHIQK